ncbi:MAG: stage V sporulation protein T [Clostridia bacterium]|nr:stage V sporulation protein T [Clostridia bacterium]
MKATGIVRRIDDLGRIVIPKEIRRTLRIREGDPLEIFVDRDGEVILKKYSPTGELGDFAKEYADSLHDATGHVALVCDREAVIAVAGAPKREFLDRRVGTLVERVLATGEPVFWNGSGSPPEGGVTRDEPRLSFRSVVVCPIVARGEAIGAVVLGNREDGRTGEVELKLAQTAARFLSRQMAV